MKAHLIIDAGRAELQPLSFAVALGSFSGNIVLDGREAVPAASIDMTINRVSLERFFQSTKYASETQGTIAGRLNLSGRGRSTAEILGDSNGHASVFMANGWFSNQLVAAAGLNIAKLLDIELTGDKAVPVRCMVADFDVSNGLMTSRALVFDTTSSAITGSGTINLKSEDVDMRLEAHPKHPSPLSARAPVLVRGTLGHPDVGIDTKAEIARGGVAAALGALLTPLAALIPFIDPGLGHNTPCTELIQQAEAP